MWGADSRDSADVEACGIEQTHNPVRISLLCINTALLCVDRIANFRKKCLSKIDQKSSGLKRPRHSMPY